MKTADDLDLDLESAPEPWDWGDEPDKEAEADLLAQPIDALHPSSRKQRSDTAHLDGLRGIASLLVYLSHITPWWYGIDSVLHHGFGYHGEWMFATFPFIRNLYTGGISSVAIFFVMSGYVLSVSPLKLLDVNKTEARRYLLVAAVKRPIRLFGPVVLLSLLFALWLHSPFAPQIDWPKAEPGLGLEVWKWLKEMVYLVNVFAPHGPNAHWFPYNPPAWTMAAELAGSLGVYGMLYLTAGLGDKTRMRCFMLVGGVLFALYQWELACFMFGVVLAMDKHEVKDSRISSGILVLALWLLGQPAGKLEPEQSYGTPGWYYATTLFTPPNYYKAEYWRWWNVIGAVLLIDGVRRLESVKGLLRHRWPQWLGRVSFMLYLVHIPVLWTVGDKVARVLGVQRQAFSTVYDDKWKVPDLGPWGVSSGFLIWQMLMLPFNLWLARLATKWIDEPSLRAGKWFVGKIGLR